MVVVVATAGHQPGQAVASCHCGPLAVIWHAMISALPVNTACGELDRHGLYILAVKCATMLPGCALDHCALGLTREGHKNHT